MTKQVLQTVLGFILVLAFSIDSLGQILPTKFNSTLEKIKIELEKYKSKEIDTIELSQGGVRQLLFTSQTLAQLYSEKYPELQSVRRSTKRLEDSIGGLRKTIEQLDFAKVKGANQSVLEKLEDDKTFAKKNLEDLIENDNYLDFKDGQIGQMLDVIAAIKWSDDSQEKIDSFKMIAGQITRVDQTPWDMTRLEGQGVHDLRKEMRWYKLQVGAMSDFIGTHQNSCGAGPLTPVMAESGGRCLISSCLQDKMSEVYDVFGAIKDEGEGQDGLGQHADQTLLKPAQDLYAEIKTKEIFKSVSAELNQCANALTGAE